jgi:hypothetical protein
VHELAILFRHLLATVARLAGPGGARSVIAESVLVTQQLLILNRSRSRSPHLLLADRKVAGVCALLMRPGRLIRSAIVLKPLHALEPPSSPDEAEISPASLAPSPEEAEPQGTHPGSHGRRRRHETAGAHQRAAARGTADLRLKRGQQLCAIRAARKAPEGAAIRRHLDLYFRDG